LGTPEVPNAPSISIRIYYSFPLVRSDALVMTTRHSLDRLTQEKNNSDTVSYSYSDVGLRTNMTVTGENTVFYQYENANKLTSVTQAKFTAREDDGTGFYYYRARYYHPALGRFIREDPIEYAGGDANFYAYVSSNPINAVDPGGLTKVYGNWCGPDWTGARPERFSPHPRGYYSPPIDALDSACLVHDVCYYQCRKSFP
jgi:RHS repeat-associated protein